MKRGLQIVEIVKEKPIGRCDAETRCYRTGIDNACPLSHFFRRMRLFKQLLRYLTEIIYKANCSVFLQGIIDTVKIKGKRNNTRFTGAYLNIYKFARLLVNIDVSLVE